MNAVALVAGVLTFAGFLVHLLIGGAELKYLVRADTSAKSEEVRRQMINGWHWVSADLALAALALVAIALTDWIPHERFALTALCLYFLIVGATFLLTTLIQTRARPILVLRLGQWLFCFLVSALAWAAR